MDVAHLHGRGVQPHHLEHDHRTGAEYKDTRHTRLDELDPVCGSHHDLHTHHGWALVPGTGKRPMVPPEDPRHPAHGPPAESGAGPAPPGPPDAASADAGHGPQRCSDPVA